MSFVRPKIRELVFQLFGKPLHPELFEVSCSRTVQRGQYEAKIDITTCGHVVTWCYEGITLTEVVASADQPLPEKRRLMSYRLKGERCDHVQCKGGVSHQVSFQFEPIEPEVFWHFQQELASEGERQGMLHLFSGSGRVAVGALSYINVETRNRKMLVERLRENDRVAIVTYAEKITEELPSTPGSDKKTILDALDRLQPAGSTNGGQGIQLAYQVAERHFIKGGTNRVILSTDGDFNVGATSDAELVRLVEAKAKSGVFLTALGFGIGNHNDSMLEQIVDKGNGNYAYVDSELETRKVFVEQLGATLVTIAKDVKIQVEFNPGKVAAYRLIGYENRMLKTEDFKDDTKDAGEIGAGHTVTALYEFVPAGEPAPADTTSLKYQKASELTPAAKSAELATVYLRYKEPEGDTSKRLEFALKESDTSAGTAAADFTFAAAVASFGMLLRNSQHKGTASYDSVLKLAAGASDDEHGYRQEFIELVKAATAIQGK